ncbi:sulfatase-like hydrolase/transferase, partial [Candidatus Kaiserbacteria bacterium]|nr:sulfatase-like hydrolase/transferase [Candidatus Kaiserbacteria bacterium]
WVRLGSSASSAQSLITKQDANRVGYGLFTTEGKLSLQGRDASASVRYAETGTTVLQPGTWYFIVGVADRTGGYRLYVNGAQEATTRTNALTDQDGSMANAWDFVIGANLNTGNYAHGLIDEVALYDRALSSSEVSALYASATNLNPAGRPNIVVIMTDDQDDTGSLSVMTKTKSLLQDQGTTFQNSFVDFPVCCPARASFMTGQAAHNHGVLGNVPETDGGYQKFQPIEANTLQVWLRQAGYTTALIGKYLNGYGAGSVSPTYVPPGWDVWKGLPDSLGTYQYYGYSLNENGTLTSYGITAADYQTDVLAQKAANFIAGRSGSSEPFFLWMTPLAPHIASKSYSSHSPEPALRHLGMFGGVPLPQTQSFNEADMSDKPAFMREHSLLDASALTQATNLFRDRRESLLSVDDMVEKIVQALQAAGKLDNTIIVYTSDNGYFQGEHRRSNNKYLVYEESIRVPLVIRGPGVPKNQTRSQMVNTLDVVASIIELAKASAGKALDGRSLTPLFQNPAAPWRSAILVQGADQSGLDPKIFSGRYQAVRTPQYVYVEHTTNEQELYDLTKDPYELSSEHNNSAYVTVKNTLTQILSTLRTCSGASCWYAGESSTSPPPAPSPTPSPTNPPPPAPYNLFAPIQTPSGPVQPISGAAPSVPTSNPIVCPVLVRNLSRGSSGQDVIELQNFLIAQGDLGAGNDTGFYGSLTQLGVQSFQRRNGIVSSGSPATTGYGAVGPRTRAVISAVCAAGALTGTTGNNARDVEDYWTPERMQSAQPMNLGVVQNSLTCPNLYRTLSFSARGNDVAELQRFLIAKGFLSAGNDSGYFGPLTEATVKKFQCNQNIVCVGTPSTTGYGTVGPRTRAAIMHCN